MIFFTSARITHDLTHNIYLMGMRPNFSQIGGAVPFVVLICGFDAREIRNHQSLNRNPLSRCDPDQVEP